MIAHQHFYSHGKLLITGEYMVLDGALALAVPTRKGQSLEVETVAEQHPELLWQSFSHDGRCWFSGHFSLPEGKCTEASDQAVGARLEQVIRAATRMRAGLLEQKAAHGLRVSTRLEFPRNWGLGTSSTLIANLAEWWQLDPYRLLAETFGGSGYDLACAGAGGAVFYRLEAGRPVISPTFFQPAFHRQLHFLYLEQKQNSRSGIADYRTKGMPPPELMEKISDISAAMTGVSTLPAFCELLEEHESIIARWMETQTVKAQLFPDFPGSIKSLGAWGGDFVLVASELSDPELETYFLSRGYKTLIPFREMVLSAENAPANPN